MPSRTLCCVATVMGKAERPITWDWITRRRVTCAPLWSGLSERPISPRNSVRPTVAAAALTNHAHVARRDSGASGVALGFADQALDLAKQAGNRYQQAAALDALGSAELRLGDAAQAANSFTEGVRIGTELGTDIDLVARLLGLAQAEQLLGQNRRITRPLCAGH